MESGRANNHDDRNMLPVYRLMADEIIALYSHEPHRQLLVAIAGPPGVGKSTTAQALASLVPGSIVLPMDGYHYTKAHLNSLDNATEAFKRRGAHWTFDAPRFLADLRLLKENKAGKFPSFDHAIGIVPRFFPWNFIAAALFKTFMCIYIHR